VERTYQGIIHQKITGARKEQKCGHFFESSFRFSKNRFYQISFIKNPLNGKKVAVRKEEERKGHRLAEGLVQLLVAWLQQKQQLGNL
jgi:hypothetical protein